MPVHMLADMLEPLFGFDGIGFIELRNRIWTMLVEQAVADGLPGLIATFVFERSVPETMVPDVRDHVVENGGIVRFVHIVCERSENERRLASAERTRFKKMTSADTFNSLQEDDLSRHIQPHSGFGALHDALSAGRYTDTRYNVPEPLTWAARRGGPTPETS